MTQDEAINLAVECGFTITHLGESPLLMASGRDVERFARKVIEMEREACAGVCEKEAKQWSDAGCFNVRDFKLCSAAIRARGDE